MDQKPIMPATEPSTEVLPADTTKVELLEKNAKLDAILASIGDGIVGTDNEGTIVVMNTVAKTLLGWTAEEVIGKKIFDIIVIEDKDGAIIPLRERVFMAVLKTGQPIVIPFPSYYVAKGGRKVPVAINVTPVLLEKKIIGTVNVFHDAAKELALEHSRNEFEALATHQLRAPITAIKWSVEMLTGTDVVSAEEQKQALGEIKEAACLLTEVVNSILNISKMEAGVLAVDPQPLNIPDLVEALAAEVAGPVSTRQLKFDRQYDKDLPILNADPKLTSAMLRNILSNAIKYTPKGGTILLKVEKQAHDILLSVADTGIGIPKNQQDRMFTRFFRADNAQESGNEGTGLGLYFVKMVVERAGGRVWFTSEEGKGTTFYITIPLEGMTKHEGLKGLS